MELLWLLGIPASVFSGAAFLIALYRWSLGRARTWWIEPACITITFCVMLAMICGFVGSLYMALRDVLS